MVLVLCRLNFSDIVNSSIDDIAVIYKINTLSTLMYDVRYVRWRKVYRKEEKGFILSDDLRHSSGKAKITNSEL